MTGPRGTVSGMLAASIITKPARRGGWIIFFTGKRAKPRPGEILSAVESTLGLMPGQTVPVTITSPRLDAALQKVAKSSFVSDLRKGFKAANRIASAINRAGRSFGFSGDED